MSQSTSFSLPPSSHPVPCVVLLGNSFSLSVGSVSCSALVNCLDLLQGNFYLILFFSFFIKILLCLSLFQLVVMAFTSMLLNDLWFWIFGFSLLGIICWLFLSKMIALLSFLTHAPKPPFSYYSIIIQFLLAQYSVFSWLKLPENFDHFCFYEQLLVYLTALRYILSFWFIFYVFITNFTLNIALTF